MSYTSKQFLIYDNSSDANFRAWGSAVSAAIAAMGWVSNGDSGQVNWATVSSPAAAAFVYECWKPGDAGTTFVLKVEYGSNGTVPKGPRLRMTIASASNGSGTLTGVVSNVLEPTKTAGLGGQGAVITYDCYFSGDTDRLGMMLWRSLNNTVPVMFVVERTHNVDGTNNNEGVTLAALTQDTASGVNSGQQTIVFGVAAGNQATSRQYVSITQGVNSSGVFNNNIPVSPAFPDYGKYGNPMTTLAFVHSQDVAEGAFFDTTLYGVTRTYLATGLLSLVTPGSSKACMRYD